MGYPLLYNMTFPWNHVHCAGANLGRHRDLWVADLCQSAVATWFRRGEMCWICGMFIEVTKVELVTLAVNSPTFFLMYSHFYPFQHIVFIIWAVFKTLVGWSLLGLSWYHPWRSWRSWIPVLIQKSSAVPRVLSWMGHGGNSAGTWKKDPHENWAVFESPVDD